MARVPSGWRGVGLAGLLGLAGCASGPDASDRRFAPQYLGVETRMMDGELVNFNVAMRGARSEADVIAYARCAAAQYALIRGYGFARHLRTNVSREGGISRADAVYTISPALPRGTRTIDSEVVVADCQEQNIPTV
ncbi:MAG: hypothetical protein JJU42_04415 [Rhodobacteraceae bacterium]|nr:hypothetical protein [Paracoccaceae bacterium]